MRNKKKLNIILSFTICAIMPLLFVTQKLNPFGISATGCTHTRVEHYASNEEHVEHWACCSCHTAWSDSEKQNIIGNTISDRSNIDVPLMYSYNGETGKIEYGRSGESIQEITPNRYVSALKFHGNNNNVMQFKAGALGECVNTTLRILNPQNISDTFGLTKSTKSSLVYWSDSQTYGFQQGGAFSSFSLNKHVYAHDLIVTDNTNYYVVGLMGATFAERQGVMKNISGVFEDKIINASKNNGKYYVELAAKINTTFWSVSGDSVGTDWTYSGGTCYLFNKIHNGVESEYAHVTSLTQNGTFPSGIAEATLNVRNQTIQNIKLGFGGTGYSFVEGDKIILKAGSIFCDDANGNDAVYVKEDITFVFTEDIFTLYLGEVDLTDSIGQCWPNHQIVFTMPSLLFDLEYFYLNRCEGQWSSNEHAVLSTIRFEFTDIHSGNKHNNSNENQTLTYYNNGDLLGIKGQLDIADSYVPSLDDTLTIPAGSYVGINSVGAYKVTQDVRFQLTRLEDDGNTIGWTNISEATKYDVPVYDTSKKIHIGASNDLNSSTIINHSTGVVRNDILEGLQDGGFNLLTGNYTIIENDGHKNNLLTAGANYGIDFIFKPRTDWTTNQDYVTTNASNFLGYEMKDEPTIDDVSDFQSLRSTFASKSYSNKYFFTNLHPIYSPASYIGNSYENYVKAYVEDCNFNILSFDNYSLYQDRASKYLSWSKTKLRDNWLSNFSTCSYYAKKNNIPLWYTFLSTQHNIGQTFRYVDPSALEMSYQMYVGMSFGATGLTHYVLEHDHNIDTSGNEYGTPILNESGAFTSTYNNAKTANLMVRNWDDVYMNHTWLGVSGVVGSSKTYSNDLNNNLNHQISVSSTGVLNSVTSTGDLLVSHFEDATSHKAIMLTNFIIPSDNHASSVNLNFDSKYKAVKIYKGNSTTFAELNNGTISLTIEPGSAAFIVPLSPLN